MRRRASERAVIVVRSHPFPRQATTAMRATARMHTTHTRTRVHSRSCASNEHERTNERSGGPAAKKQRGGWSFSPRRAQQQGRKKCTSGDRVAEWSRKEGSVLDRLARPKGIATSQCRAEEGQSLLFPLSPHHSRAHRLSQLEAMGTMWNDHALKHGSSQALPPLSLLPPPPNATPIAAESVVSPTASAHSRPAFAWTLHWSLF